MLPPLRCLLKQPKPGKSLLVVATIPVLAVLVGTLGAAAVMFFSTHDLAAMLIVAAAAGTVALGVTDPDGAEPPPLSASRGCMVVAASAVAPGSGHVLLGHRRTGGALLGIYLLAVASAAMVGVLAWRSWGTLVAHAVNDAHTAVACLQALGVFDVDADGLYRPEPRRVAAWPHRCDRSPFLVLCCKPL